MDTTKGTGAADIPTGVDAFTKNLQENLMKSSEAISSSPTGVQKTVDEAIAARKEATIQGAELITSQSDREIQLAREKAQREVVSVQESERGFGRSMATYRQMEEDSNKNIKDLDQRKKELILQNNIAGVNAVEKLQMDALKFKQDAMQQTFSNLLGMSNWNIQKRAQDLAERGQNFTVRSQTAAFAMKYGVKLNPDDTIDTLMAKIPAGTLSREEAATLARFASETKLNNARVAEIRSGEVFNSTDSGTVDANAQAARRDTSILQKLNPQARALATNRAAVVDKEEVEAVVRNKILAGESKENILVFVNDPKNKLSTFLGYVETEKLVNQLYPEIEKENKEKASLAKHAQKGVSAIGRTGWSAIDYILGTDVVGDINIRGGK